MSELCSTLSKEDLERNLSLIKTDRTLIKDIMAYCAAIPNKILGICGLRRTGKTILMMRQALNLIQSGEIVTYIQISKDDTQQQLRLTIQAAKDRGSKYIFIEEVTFVDGFANGADWIYNNTVLVGVHCIMAGTDSFGLIIASKQQLFDRIAFIRTTHMWFAEYNKITGKTLTDYMHDGGVFGNFDANDYIETSITRNIIDSINRYSDDGYRGLSKLEDDEIRTLIITTISRIGFEFTIRLFRKYRYNELGSAKELIQKKITTYIVEKEEEIKQEVGRILGITEPVTRLSNTEKQDCIQALQHILESIDVVVKYDDILADNDDVNTRTVYLLTQPALRYEITLVYLGVIARLTGEELLSQKIVEDIEGNLLEAVMSGTAIRTYMTHANEASRTHDVFKCRYDGSEIDLVIYSRVTKKLGLFEIKRTQNPNDEQSKNLTPEIIDGVKKLVISRNLLAPDIKSISRYVLYGGKDNFADDPDEIGLLSFETYLNRFRVE